MDTLFWVYLINVVLIILGIVAYWRHLRAQRRRDRKYAADSLAARRRTRRSKPPQS